MVWSLPRRPTPGGQTPIFNTAPLRSPLAFVGHGIMSFRPRPCPFVRCIPATKAYAKWRGIVAVYVMRSGREPKRRSEMRLKSVDGLRGVAAAPVAPSIECLFLQLGEASPLSVTPVRPNCRAHSLLRRRTTDDSIAVLAAQSAYWSGRISTA